MWTDNMTVKALENLFISAGLRKPQPALPMEEVQEMREMVDHARNCAECAAILGITDFLLPARTASDNRGASTVVNMQEWLLRKSRGKLML